MATKVSFAGKQRILPGVYSTIKSKINNPSIILDYGRVVIIDNGKVNAAYGGGAGIDGELDSRADAIYRFSEIAEFRDFVKGGYFWKLAEPLFFPDQGAQGVSEIIFAKAATTVAAKDTWSPVGGGSAGGTFIIQVRDEGLIGNGAIDEVTSELITGYGWKVITGRKDTAKWIIQIYVGGFKGDYSGDSIPFDEIESADSDPRLILESPEFDNVQDLIDWGNDDADFTVHFYMEAGTVTGTGVIDADDVNTVSGWNLFAGGTESYTSANLTLILDELKDIDFNFLLTDCYGKGDYNDALNTLFETFVKTDAKFDGIMYIGGGDDSTEFIAADGSQDIAEYFDSDRMVVVHGGVKTPSNTDPSGFRTWDALYHTAIMLGRTAGLEPQIPLTFKRLNLTGLADKLNTARQEIALESGILTSFFDTDSQDFRVIQGVNSLQNNTYLINSDSTSFSIQLIRIIAQLNRELTIKGKLEILHNPQGVNLSTVSKEYIKNWVESYLQTRVATPTEDDLILSYQDVVVTQDQDTYSITYSVVANTEITKIFITGFLIN